MFTRTKYDEMTLWTMSQKKLKFIAALRGVNPFGKTTNSIILALKAKNRVN